MTFQNPYNKTKISFLEKISNENKNFASCTQIIIFLLLVKLKTVTDCPSFKETRAFREQIEITLSIFFYSVVIWFFLETGNENYEFSAIWNSEGHFFLSKLKKNRTRNVTLQIIFKTNVKRIRISS